MAAFRRVRGTHPAVTAGLFVPMQLGAGAAPVVVAVAAVAVGLPRRTAVGVAVTGLGAWWAAKGVKHVVARSRPLALVPGATVAPGGSRDGLGFVSGHAAVAAATATVLTPALPPRWRPVPAVLAAVISAARIQNGSHLPLDVIGGAGLGLVLGGGWLYFFG